MSKKSKDERDVFVIDAVRKVPAIWKVSHPHYKDTLKKPAYWDKVAAFANLDTKFCQDTWKRLRSAYVKSRKRMGTGSGADEEEVTNTYAYAEEMDFLAPEIADRPQRATNLGASQADLFSPLTQDNDSPCNTTGTSETGDDDNSEGEPEPREVFKRPAERKLFDTPGSSKPSKSAKLDPIDAHLLQLATKREDQAEIFGRSVARFLQDLPPHMFDDAKFRMEMLMYSIKTGRELQFEPPPMHRFSAGPSTSHNAPKPLIALFCFNALLL